MAVVNFREILPRSFSHKFGESPTASRVFNITLDGPTNTQDILGAVGIFHGAAHPEYPYLLCVNGDLSETDRYHAEVTYSYEVPQVGSQDADPNPLTRPDVWSFSTGGSQVPAFTSYFGTGDQQAPLVNSAGDFFEGLTRLEAEVRCTISGNRPTFDYGLASQVTNCINRSAYLGGQPFTWLCSGISGQQQVEVVNGVEVKYWSFTTELVFRASTHLLFLPDVGFNYLATSIEDDSPADIEPDDDDWMKNAIALEQSYFLGPLPLLKKPRTTAVGVKKRAYVIDPESGEKVASSNPVALNADGSIKAAGTPPNILVRRVNRAIDFAEFFGTPTF